MVPLKIGAARPQIPLVQGVVVAGFMPVVVAVPIVLEQGVEISEDEKNSIQSKPADWAGAIIAPSMEVPMTTAVVGGDVSLFHGLC